jgi:Family of unknown function (DUF5686)/CarboxypepD_reg-like domain
MIIKNNKLNPSKMKLSFLALFIPFLSCNIIFAQSNSKNSTYSIEGVVIDSIAGDTIAFANILEISTNNNVTSNESGHFKITLSKPTTQLKVSYLGYRSKIINISNDEPKSLIIKIVDDNFQLKEVVVRVERYKNKNNPAVDLIKKVIDKKDQNQLEKYDYYDYQKYERLEMSLANVAEKLEHRKIAKNINFFFKDTDTSSIKGKSILPTYIAENSSEVFYRKSTNTTKEILLGNKHSNIGTLFDDKGMNDYLSHLYVQANIYDNEILMFKKPFLSPLSPIAPTFYRYYIIDTVVVDGKRCVNLGFFPRSKADLTFVGNLYITDDSLYALRKVELSVPNGINVNFINNLKITQNFDRMPDGTWIKIHDEIKLDLGLGDTKNGQGIYGVRNIYYTDFKFNEPKENGKYEGIGSIMYQKDYQEKSDTFWANARTEKLNATQQHIYAKTDSLMKVPDFQLFMAWKYFMVTGFWQTKYAEFGPIASSVSYNDLEGMRLRLGGRTLQTLSDHIRLDAYGAYGFRDKKFKYNSVLTYQLNNEPFGNRPQKAFKAWSYYDVEVPGQNVENVPTDNWLLSFHRGGSDKRYYKQAYGLSYTDEQMNGFSYNVGIQYRKMTPAGSLTFSQLYIDSNLIQKIPNLSTNEVFANFRYAPKEEYLQGATYRKRIVNKYPVFEAKFKAGISQDAIGTKTSYQEVNLSAFKRFFIAPIGHTDILLEAGRVFGKNISYPMLHNFSANQTLYYEEFSYNQMNYLEFISDKYASINIEHAFDGFFLNKIPLIKKLKWREFATFKALYGGLDTSNDPNQNNNVYRFPTNPITGQSLTYSFDKMPYMEASIGIGNIFKVARIDVVRRLSYLDHTDVSKWRIAMDINFGL